MEPQTGRACSKQVMLAALPRREGDLSIRAQLREDLDALARWPAYPAGHESFNLRFAGMDGRQRDDLFRTRQADPSRITLIADHASQPCIGYLGLVEIDWSKRLIANMGYRIHPSWCNRGIGTRFLRIATAWCFAHGIETLRLDVAAVNGRAIRCYEKVGFLRTGEFWLQDPKLRGVVLNQPEHDTLRPHVRQDGGMPYVRFYWMQLGRLG